MSTSSASSFEPSRSAQPKVRDVCRKNLSEFDAERLRGQKLTQDLIDAKSGEVIVEAETKITPRLIRKLAEQAKEAGDNAANQLDDAAHLLFDQARILEGEPVSDAAAFAQRFARVMEKAV